MIIRRKISSKIEQLFSKYPVLIVTGPRQSGKTTLVRNAFPKLKYTSLKDLDNREFAINDPRGFLSGYEKGGIIVEIQRVPELLSYNQTISDIKNSTGHFILTGSQNILLQHQVSQSLAGRAAIIKLLPFNIEEANLFSSKETNFENVIYKGFYPRIYDKELDPKEWYSNHIQSYIERDVQQLKNALNQNVFQKFIRLCA